MNIYTSTISSITTIIYSMICISMFSNTYASFEDINSHIYQSAIEQLENMNIIQGYQDNTFRPDQGITRAELLKIIMIGAGIPLSTDLDDDKKCFSDIKENERYTDYVCTARQLKIIGGYTDGSFQPYKTISNTEGIKIALKAFGITPVSLSQESTQQTEKWYSDYLSFVHQNNIFSRYSIYPDGRMTRGMMSHLTVKIINQGSTPRSYIRDNRSLGCQKPQPNSLPTSLSVGNISRNIITDIGTKYSQTQPTKLIIAFHGRTNPNTLIRKYYDIDEASDDKSIIVYPLGLPEQGPTRSRQDPGDKPNNLRDYSLFDAIVQDFSDQYCIDQDEVYVVGHSLGAWFANTLACARGDVIRAVGSVGGSNTKTICTGPTSAIIMHHPKDNLASYTGGVLARDAALIQNQCNLDKKVPIGPVGGNCEAYTSCLDGSEVVRCPHNDDTENGRYYPHTRPNFAGQTIWNFFVRKLK